MKLKLKNIGGGQPVVRIIRLTGETTLDNSDNQFTVMDEAGMDFGIVLAPGPAPIQCDGAIAHASIINIGGEVLEGPNPFTLEVNDLPPVECADFNDLANALDDENFRVYVLEDWDPLFVPPLA